MIIDIALGIVLAVVILAVIIFGIQISFFLLWGICVVVSSLVRSFVQFLENLGRND